MCSQLERLMWKALWWQTAIFALSWSVLLAASVLMLAYYPLPTAPGAWTSVVSATVAPAVVVFLVSVVAFSIYDHRFFREFGRTAGPDRNWRSRLLLPWRSIYDRYRLPGAALCGVFLLTHLAVLLVLAILAPTFWIRWLLPLGLVWLAGSFGVHLLLLRIASAGSPVAGFRPVRSAFAALLLLPALVGGGVLGAEKLMEHRTRAKMAELKQYQLFTSIEDIENYYTPVAKDGAPTLYRAIELEKRIVKDLGRKHGEDELFLSVFPLPRYLSEKEQIQSAAPDYLAAKQPVIDELDRLGPFEQTRYRRDWRQTMNMQLTELNYIRGFGRLNALRMIALIPARRTAEIWRIYQDSGRIWRQLLEDPILICGLVAFAVERVQLEAMNTVINQIGDFPEPYLRAIIAEMAAVEPEVYKNYLLALSGHVVIQTEYMRAFKSNNKSAEDWAPDEKTWQYCETVDRIFRMPLRRWVVEWNLRFLPDDARRAVAIGNFDGFDLAAYEAESKRLAGKPTCGTEMFYNFNSRLVPRYLNALAAVRTMKVSVALELYFRKYGVLPEDPAKLVPEFLAQLPSDPFTGQPLLYRRGEIAMPVFARGEPTDEKQIRRGAVVYSVGRDLKDDGGYLFPFRSGNPRGYRDVGFVLLR